MKGSKRSSVASAPMAEVPVRVLKDRLSELLRAVESGSTVVVTSHGRALADLVPHRERAPFAASLLTVRQPSRPWGSVRRRRTGRGGTNSTGLLLEERRRR